ncbi:XRE family transcriptional regulator [Lentilactobacillus buchneri]|nr:XRE family transcriptional regulator [Lentilactobacillus buchneri]
MNYNKDGGASMTNDKNQLGNYLKKLRGNLSYREVARRSGNKISHSAVAQAEKGINTRGKSFVPSPDTLKELSKVYHASYDDLMIRAGYLPTATNAKTTPTFDGIEAAATTKWETSHEPLDVYGKITAGIPTFADEHIIGQTIIPDDLIRRFGRDNLFALQVNGDSMSRVIAPGFIAVFAKDCGIDNGDICAVLIDGENATLKRFKETSKAVILEPESFNPIYKPLIFPKNIDQDFRILGKYVFATSLLQ